MAGLVGSRASFSPSLTCSCLRGARIRTHIPRADDQNRSYIIRMPMLSGHGMDFAEVAQQPCNVRPPRHGWSSFCQYGRSKQWPRQSTLTHSTCPVSARRCLAGASIRAGAREACRPLPYGPVAIAQAVSQSPPSVVRFGGEENIDATGPRLLGLVPPAIAYVETPRPCSCVRMCAARVC